MFTGRKIIQNEAPLHGAILPLHGLMALGICPVFTKDIAFI
jgi:hypothetical protein